MTDLPADLVNHEPLGAGRVPEGDLEGPPHQTGRDLGQSQPVGVVVPCRLLAQGLRPLASLVPGLAIRS